MFDELIPGLSTYMALSAVMVVSLSEILKRVLPSVKGKPFLSGIYFTLPLILSILISVFGHISGEFPEWKTIITDIITLYGTSVLIYEAVLKRISKVWEGINEANSGDNSSTADSSSGSDTLR